MNDSWERLELSELASVEAGLDELRDACERFGCGHRVLPWESCEVCEGVAE